MSQRELARAQCPICVRNITETLKQNIPTLHNSTTSRGALLHTLAARQLQRAGPRKGRGGG
ncbi:hypothetical protein [Xanthomonas phaseoli]|uniref:hypothetical protein n=1 Tax=Xanthomonas phaseoli TaxID=1985254 RepID=UPI0009B6E0B9|nr:hypothetical protein [Xanthomonas phaseoli]RWU13313.1 hypothetical protein XANMN_22170 [Xanthomonas phaseoli pv. manihotis str. CIO151]